MLRNWRPWVLIVLLVGPILAYIGFGFLWLRERGWIWVYAASSLWIASGVILYILADRWTKSRQNLLPPIDWDAPRTFSEHDRKGWMLVQEEASKGETLSMQQLSEFDTYIEVGRALARRLAAHYQPLSTDPVEHVPVVELLSALELAAEDLNRLCRQVPGGDLITPAHWKRAVQVSGYIQKANDIYSYLLPIFQPLTGIPRLAAQKLMVRPAWKNMQQNLMRWFFTAFVNRLGTHLIELYSGRLSIGADQYRKLTRKGIDARATEEAMGPLVVAVAGAQDAGKSRLIAAIEAARAGDLGPVRVQLQTAGLDPSSAERLKTIRLVEVGYISRPGGETARERSTRRAAVEEAANADLMLLVIDAARDDTAADVDFARAWKAWFDSHPGREQPPALTVLTGADRPALGDGWKPPYQWSTGHAPREAAVRARMAALRSVLPPGLTEIVAVGLPEEGPPFGVSEEVLPVLATLLHRSDRAHLLRHIQNQQGRSKVSRFISQVGQQGRHLWDRRKKTGQAAG